MKRFRTLFIYTIAFSLLIGIFFFRHDILDFYSDLSFQLPQIEEVAGSLIQEAEKQISTPPPLRVVEEKPESFLTQAGIIQWTNVQREKYGLPELVENEHLDVSAEIKIQDMFGKQYFAHDSPVGIGIADLAEMVGYEFIGIAENLALGDFQNDEALVQGWMDSAGHRANILNERYREIGVAIKKDTFEGRDTWMAVQHFGLPLSVCSQPDEVLGQEIDENQNQMEALQKTLRALRIKIKTTRPKRGTEYNQLIEQYNSLISQYNALIKEADTLINEYNNQVILFNQCVVGVE